VFRVGAAYAIAAWVILQVADVVLDNIAAPGWVMQVIMLVLVIGFPLVIVFAWAFEVTPQGIKKEKDVDRSQSITRLTGQKLNHTIIALLALALGYFVFDKFVLDPQRDAELVQTNQSFAGQDTDLAEPAPAGPVKESIAVLPFVNMSDDGANEYFSDGLSEELLNLLAKIPELKVAARTSSFQFKGHTGDIADIGAKLKVAHILEGSVRKSGNQVRITTQLIKADDGYHLWSETYDHTLENIFQVQDEIAAAVVDALKITLLGEVPVVDEVNPDAYALYLQGRYFASQSNELNSHKSVEAYERALEIDPEYAEALAGLSLVFIWQAGFGYIEYEQGVERALALARKAVQLSPGLALAWVALSDAQGEYLWNWQASYESAQRAIELDPGSSTALVQAARITRDLGHFDQSLEMYEKAVELDPLNLTAIIQLARAYSMVDKYKESEQQYLNLLALNPDFRGVHSQYSYTLMLEGRYQEALAEAEKEPEAGWSSLLRVFALHSLGRHEESDAELETYIETHHEFWAYQIAEVYAWRNEADEAFHWLEAALQYRDPGLSNLVSDRTLRNLHSDPRWEPFLAKVGLLEAWQNMSVKYKGSKL
jgi:TolB-like protein/cytochrome c-type biogenesis protein CcmH/NrfG